MANAGKIFTFGSVFCVLFSMVLMIAGSLSEIDIEAEAAFQGTSGDFKPVMGVHTVFIQDNYSCGDGTVSIMEGEVEKFEFGCSDAHDQQGWREIGVVDPTPGAVLTVNSDIEVLIIDDFTLVGGMMMGGCGLCCLGVLGLLIGALVSIGSSKKPPTQYIMNNPSAQQFGQPMTGQPQYGFQTAQTGGVPPSVQNTYNEPVQSQYNEDFRNRGGVPEAEEKSGIWD